MHEQSSLVDGEEVLRDYVYFICKDSLKKVNVYC